MISRVCAAREWTGATCCPLYYACTRPSSATLSLPVSTTQSAQSDDERRVSSSPFSGLLALCFRLQIGDASVGGAFARVFRNDFLPLYAQLTCGRGRPEQRSQLVCRPLIIVLKKSRLWKMLAPMTRRNNGELLEEGFRDYAMCSYWIGILRVAKIILLINLLYFSKTNVYKREKQNGFRLRWWPSWIKWGSFLKLFKYQQQPSKLLN